MTSSQQRIKAVRGLARASRLLERASGEMSLAHYRVLAAVADGDERASRVATRLALGKPTISVAVDALCGRGLLVREEVEGDQRAAALRLTAAGTTVLAEVETAMLARLDDLLSHVPDAAAVMAALAALDSGLDELAAERVAMRRTASAHPAQPGGK